MMECFSASSPRPARDAGRAVIDRRTTRFLERMKAYARTRASLMKRTERGR